MPLYSITITGTTVVWTDKPDEKEAELIAVENLSDELENTGDYKCKITLIKTIKDLPKDWKDALPWGNNAIDLTCEELLGKCALESIKCFQCANSENLCVCKKCNKIVCPYCKTHKCRKS